VPWTVLDLVVYLLPVVLLALVGLSLFRHLKALARSVGDASTRVGAAMPPSPAPHR
jgi:hypothetical protein